MSNEQINTAIAEACGWTPISFEEVRKRNAGQFYLQDGPWWRSEAERIVCTQKDLPNYCTDLNAMHEAEKWMISSLRLLDFWKFAEELKRIVPANLGDDSYIHATARQRAEAFLKTLGKWEKQND